MLVADRSGMTPLHVAEQSGSDAVAAFLKDVIGARDGDATPFSGLRSRHRGCRCQSRCCEDARLEMRQIAYGGGDGISERVSEAVGSCVSVLIAGVGFVLSSRAVVFLCFAVGLCLFISVLWRLVTYWII